MNLRLLLLMFCAQLPVGGAHVQRATMASRFVIYDGTAYLHKPDLALFGVMPITVIYSGSLWKSMKAPIEIPDANTIHALALRARKSTGIAVMDIECWPVLGDPAAVARGIHNYEGTLRLFKQASPTLRIGYYGVAPTWNYWIAIGAHDTAGYKLWQAENDRVAPVAAIADVLFPAIYTFYKDRDGWRKYAIANIKEAHRIAPGKPVYVFLLPQFDEAGKAPDYLPREYWRMELETAREYANGVVIWGGSGQTWEDRAPWWLETQAFLRGAK